MRFRHVFQANPVPADLFRLAEIDHHIQAVSHLLNFWPMFIQDAALSPGRTGFFLLFFFLVSILAGLAHGGDEHLRRLSQRWIHRVARAAAIRLHRIGKPKHSLAIKFHVK